VEISPIALRLLRWHFTTMGEGASTMGRLAKFVVLVVTVAAIVSGLSYVREQSGFQPLLVSIPSIDLRPSSDGLRLPRR
jgi:hypothetical protein